MTGFCQRWPSVGSVDGWPPGQEMMIEVNHAEEGLQLLLHGRSGKVTDRRYPFAEGFDAGCGDVVAKERDLDHHAGLVKAGENLSEMGYVLRLAAAANQDVVEVYKDAQGMPRRIVSIRRWKV